MLKLVFFDLDGTLLPMEQERFLDAYFGLLAKKCEPFGYDPKRLIDAIWHGTKAMVANDGATTNEAVFWNTFAGIFGERVYRDETIFDDFYMHDFEKVRDSVGYNPKAAGAVHAAKSRGLRVALATNPVFPTVATEARIRWAGLAPTDFECYTTYENIGFCKPNPAYYQELCRRLNVLPQECLMVGNDTEEDMVAADIGMDVFLLTDCVINRSGRPLADFPHGGFDELIRRLSSE